MKSLNTGEKHKYLFQAISESVALYGTEGLEFILTTHLENINVHVESSCSKSLINLFTKINKIIEIHGIDHVVYLIQNKKNILSEDYSNLKHTKKLNNKVFEIVGRIFKTPIEIIITSSDRDGIRVFASGTIIKIFSEVLDYSAEEISELIPKSKSIISRHKIMVSNLDYKHPVERPMLKLYLFCKHEIINFIIKQDGN